MPFVVATEAHVIPERPPLSLASGDVVTVGRRDSDWPAFVFVTAAGGSGWVPSRYLSADAGRAVVETPYNTTELATRSGEILEVVERDDESGWLWCRSTDGHEGWVPNRTVEAAARSENR
jgi:SH3-like domain-containing protein